MFLVYSLVRRLNRYSGFTLFLNPDAQSIDLLTFLLRFRLTFLLGLKHKAGNLFYFDFRFKLVAVLQCKFTSCGLYNTSMIELCLESFEGGQVEDTDLSIISLMIIC